LSIVDIRYRTNILGRHSCCCCC